MDAEILRKYVERKGDGCFANTRPSQSKRRLPEAAQDAYALVVQFGNSEAAALESVHLLERIFHEQCEVTDDPTAPVAIRPPRTSNFVGVIRPADSDARYNKHNGTGYLVQIMETLAADDAADPEMFSSEQDDAELSPPDLITHVAVDPLTMHDQDALVPALTDTQTPHVGPQELLADSHYGSNDSLS